MEREELINKIHRLQQELKLAKEQLNKHVQEPETVIVPDAMSGLFGGVETKIRSYFNDLIYDPNSGEITIEGQRYVLFRSDSMSHEFLELIKERYADRSEHEAVSIGNNFLYDIAKVIGKKDAIAFHRDLGLKESIEKLSAGPIHFAFTGWANVEISPESNPVPNDDYFLKFQHHNSFEAQSWLKAGKKSDIPVCTMNCGYSAGWCEESFGLSLTTVEITCEAKGDDACTFIMAPTHKIEEYLGEQIDLSADDKVEIPVFFKRQKIEEQLRESVEQKELLIQEIHHRVKNNLQVINSLLRLQMGELKDPALREEFESSINRVNTMAVVHELMYQGQDFDQVSMRKYISELMKSLVNLYSLAPGVEIDINVDISEVEFDLSKSIPLALILNEITCNSFKHGLKGGGKFYLNLSEKEDHFELVVGDTGAGMEITEGNLGLGLALIDILVDQIDAEKEIKNTNEGLEYTIRFNLDKK